MGQPVYVAMVEQHYAGHVAIHGAWASKEEALAALRSSRHASFLGSDIVLYECHGLDCTEVETLEIAPALK